MIDRLNRSVLAGLIAVLIAGLNFSPAIAGDANAGHAEVSAELGRSLELIAAGAIGYVEQRKCFSCHHQSLPLLALTHARQQGLPVDEAAVTRQVEFTRTYFDRRKERVARGEDVPGGAYSAGYALLGLAAANHPPDEVTDALVGFLNATQREDGGWRIQTHRPPLEDSHFTATALAVRGLKHYARDAAATDERIRKAQSWLCDTAAVTNEDRSFRVWGLLWSAAPTETLATATAELRAMQRPDGGWSQTAELASDAYATGQALVALRDAGGGGAGDAAWLRGTVWLKSHRLFDGSWRVESRSRPFQTYFESGFPHGKLQFISISATCWATMALTPNSQSK